MYSGAVADRATVPAAYDEYDAACDDGRVEWIPPPLLDTGQDRINHYWHPEGLLHPPGEDHVEDP